METVTLETPQRLAIVSSVGVTDEWEHKLISSTSLLVNQRLVLKRFLLGCSRTDELGGVGPYFAPGPGEERINRLELDVEWVGEE